LSSAGFAQGRARGDESSRLCRMQKEDETCAALYSTVHVHVYLPSRQDAQPWYVETFLFHNCTGGTVCLSCQRVKRECRLY
jgi:hypothetical protein